MGKIENALSWLEKNQVELSSAGSCVLIGHIVGIMFGADWNELNFGTVIGAVAGGVVAGHTIGKKY